MLILADPSDQVRALKRRIQDVEGIPVRSQRLLFGGKQLKDDCSLSEYFIQPDSTVHLVLRLVGGHIDVRPSPNLVSLRNPIEGLNISILMLDGTEYNYIVGRPYTIDSLMGMIQNNQGIQMDRQTLIYEGEILKEFDTLKDYGVNDGDFLILHMRAPLLKSWVNRIQNAMMRLFDID
jgi:uncharacterized ubiquitin-like protein YukD